MKATTAVMGIVNLTPDSFSDGGRLTGAPAVRAHLDALIAAGADMLDVGAESTRPGAVAVPPDEQLRRLEPVLTAANELPVPLSIDTRSGTVAEACLQAGFEIVNDTSAGRHDPTLVAAAAEHGAVLIAMHMRGTPADMDQRTDYDDVVCDVAREWQDAAAAIVAAGVPHERLWFDPGLGFAKTTAQSWALCRQAAAFAGLGAARVFGPSRKRFLDLAGRPAAERDPATHALVALLARAGVEVVRVHDVAGAVQAVAAAAAMAGEDAA